MARLQSPTGELIPLRANHLIGRSRSMDLVLDVPDVSAQHAALTWDGGGWSLRDLGSRNGTWLDDARLKLGERVAVSRDAVLRFATAAMAFTLVDAGPPTPLARCGDRVIEGAEGLLALPDPEEPTAVVMLDPDLGWVVSQDERLRPIQDGDALDLDGARWQIELPAPVEQTVEAQERGGPGAVGVVFRVSADEEYVELDVRCGEAVHHRPGRAHHYLLLTLARARLANLECSEAERGWLYSEELTRMLRVSSNQLYVLMHRARQEFAELGLGPEFELFERRSTTRQFRIGVSELHVQAL